MTKQEAVINILGNDNEVDYALPQGWFDMVLDKTGENPLPHFVWYYGNKSLFGGPLPLTDRGREILEQIH